MINGQFDFNKTPLSSAGIKTSTHVTANTRKRGMNMIKEVLDSDEHPKIFVTKGIRSLNTVKFFPVKCGNPMLSDEEKISLILQDLITIVSSSTQTIPSISNGDELNSELCTMQDLM